MRKQPKLKKSGLKSGEKVMMHSCYEARKPQYADKVWTTCSEPWDLCGSEVIKLEGFRGGFATEFLKRVEVETQIHVFRLCECDAVAAESLDDAIKWYKDQTGVPDDELYPYDDIEVMSPEHKVYKDAYNGNGEEMITLSELIKQEWKGEPFIACSTEW